MPLQNLSRQHDAAGQNVLEEHATATTLTNMVQNLNRFLLQKFEVRQSSLELDLVLTQIPAQLPMGSSRA